MNLSLHGSHTKWGSGVGIDDGAGLPTKLPKSTLLFHSFIVSFCCCFSVMYVIEFYKYNITQTDYKTIVDFPSAYG